MSCNTIGGVIGYNFITYIEEVVAKLISNGGVDGMSLGGARIDALDKTLNMEKSKRV